MQTKNINHQHDPQGLAHPNCQTNGSQLLPSNGRLYGSTSELHQRTDSDNYNPNANSSNKSTITNTPTQRYGRCNYALIGQPLPHQIQHPYAEQAKSCASTPVLRASKDLLKRHTSLGQLDDRSLDRGGSISERRFGSFQQKIRALLMPKESRKSDSNSVSESSSNNQLSETNDSSQTNAMNATAVQTVSSVNINESSSNGNINGNSEYGTYNSLEEEDNAYYIRDVCSKWFGRTHNQSLLSSSMASVVNKPLSDSPKLSHNLKPVLYEKVVPKHNICQNTYANSDNQQIYCNTSAALQNAIQDRDYVEVYRTQTSNGPQVSTLNDQHVVIVSCLEANAARDTSLTVRSERTALEINTSDECGPSENTNIADSVDSAGSHDTNYKSSSESGRGTMRSSHECDAKNNSPAGVSSLDLTSLDSDQSSPANTSTWSKQSAKQGSSGDVSASNAAIEKMQMELQRILDYKCGQTCEIDGNELAKDFQSRLSVVNESDSWISTSPTPQTSAKFIDSKTDIAKTNKFGSALALNAENHSIDTLKATTSKTLPKPKQKFAQNDKQTYTVSKQIATDKQRYCAAKTAKTQNSYNKSAINERTYYNIPNRSKSRKPANVSLKSVDRMNAIDCDMASTTTARDSNGEYPDELSSEYTANTSVCDRNEVYSIRKQLKGLENMYSEIVCMLGSRLRTDGTHRNRRKSCPSVVSSVTGRSSVTSRGTRDYYYRRSKHEYKRHKHEDSYHSSRRLKRLETHVMTLAQSVAHISSEMRANHSLTREFESLRQEVDLIKDQFSLLRPTLSKSSCQQFNTHIAVSGRRNAHISAGRVEKLTKFFGDEPPLLRQFLKKLGYEKYAKNFENEKIGITELPYLTEERLQKLAIPLGPRMKIMQEIHKTASEYNLYAIV